MDLMTEFAVMREQDPTRAGLVQKVLGICMCDMQ